jgi:hypothetical protein
MGDDVVKKQYTVMKLDRFNMVTNFRADGYSFARIAKALYFPNNKTRPVTGAELKAWYEGHPRNKATQKKKASMHELRLAIVA